MLGGHATQWATRFSVIVELLEWRGIAAKGLQLPHLLGRQLQPLRQLFRRRGAPQGLGHLGAGTTQFAHPRPDVGGDVDHAGLSRERQVLRLADPPERVGRETMAALVLEALDCLQQTQVALLDQVQERRRIGSHLLGQVGHETQIAQDQRVPRLVDQLLLPSGAAQNPPHPRVVGAAQVRRHSLETGFDLAQPPLAALFWTLGVPVENVFAIRGRQPQHQRGEFFARLVQRLRVPFLVLPLEQGSRADLPHVVRERPVVLRLGRGSPAFPRPCVSLSVQKHATPPGARPVHS